MADTGYYDAPRLLASFLEAKKPLNQAQAAEQLGIVPAALTGYLKRKQRPRADIRQRIAKWSEGFVPEESWLTDDERGDLIGVKPAASVRDSSHPPAAKVS